MPTVTTAAEPKPRSRKKNAQGTDPAAEVLQAPPAEVVPFTLEELIEDSTIPFFEFLTLIPAGEWENLIAYLYRLEPKVKNRSDEPSHILKFTRPIDEDGVKQEAGGGKFLIRLNLRNGLTGRSTSVRTHTFWIDGPPKYLEGQTVQGPAPPPAAAAGNGQPASESQIAQVLKEFAAAIKDKPTEESIANAMSTMKTAFDSSMKIVTDTASTQAKSMTGNALLDKLVTTVIERMGAPAESKENPLIEKLMTAAVTRLLEKPAAPEAAATNDPLGSLGQIKELFDLDLKDLLRGGKQADNPWVTLGFKFLEAAPTLLGQYTQLRALEGENALRVAEFRARYGLGPQPTPPPGAPRGRPIMVPPPQAAEPTPIEFPAAAAAPGAPVPAAPAAGPSDFLSGLILRCFEEGDDGMITAVVIKRTVPDIAAMLTPLLSNPEQVNQFIANDPVLAQLTSEPDWPEFLHDFIAEMTAPRTPAPPVSENQAVNGMASA